MGFKPFRCQPNPWAHVGFQPKQQVLEAFFQWNLKTWHRNQTRRGKSMKHHFSGTNPMIFLFDFPSRSYILFLILLIQFIINLNNNVKVYAISANRTRVFLKNGKNVITATNANGSMVFVKFEFNP